MPWWVKLALGVGGINLVVVVLAAVSRQGSTAQWRRTTGVVTAVQHRATPATTGMVHTYVVVVRTDDGEVVELLNPPFRQIAVGDRIVQGKRVPTND